MSEQVGIVVIGRNEGERLMRCLESVRGRGLIVYVDSGSTDGSVKAAQAADAVVVELALSVPFTAARARNVGFDELERSCPRLQFVQFVDGDCEIDPGWLNLAAAALTSTQNIAVVSGRLRERRRDATSYNRLCDMEWDAPEGDAEACGGIAMIRAEAFRAVGGFNAGLIAGEEPELCMRLRKAGWRIRRLSAPMALHDAAMTRFSQWFRRTMRCGHAYAEGAWMHGTLRSGHYVRNVRSALVWGLAAPLLILALLAAAGGLAWSQPVAAACAGAAAGVITAMVAVTWYRARRWRLARGNTPPDATLYATFCMMGKVPEAIGIVRFHALRLARRRSLIVEYK